jgi:hypothetical protein
MTVSATLLGTLLHGTAAARPAANAVAGGTIYSATDTGAITQSDGSSWATFATISSGLADPMTTRGDIIIRNASNATARLGRGSAGQVFTSDGTDVAWASAPAPVLASASYRRTAGDYTTTSNTFVDVDATNVKLTIVTGARRVQIEVVGTSNVDGGAGKIMAFDVSVDGTRLGGNYGVMAIQSAANQYWHNMSFAYTTDALSAASHEFRLMYRSDGTQTHKINANTDIPLRFSVTELPT